MSSADTSIPDPYFKSMMCSVRDDERIGRAEALPHPAGEVHALLDHHGRIRAGLFGSPHMFEHVRSALDAERIAWELAAIVESLHIPEQRLIMLRIDC